MTNQAIINFLDQVRKILLDDKSWLESTVQPINEAFDKAISAVQAQELSETDTCVGCKHHGKWENEVEYGYSSPCTICRRRMNDNYEQ